MVDRITVEQVRAWLDTQVVSGVEEISGSETEFNLQLEVSRLPIHVIKERPDGPVRIVGKSGFDTDRVAALLDSERQRHELLTRIGPVLLAVPGFYSFLDEEGERCSFENVHTIQIEHRLYPDALSQHQLMTSVIAIAKGMRYIQNTVTIVRESVSGAVDGENGAFEERDGGDGTEE